MSGRPSTVEAATHTRKVLWILGLYHGKRHPKHAFFGLVRACSLAIIIIFPTLMIVYIVACETESGTVFFTLLFTYVVLRTILHMCNLPKMRAVEDLLEDEIFNMQTEWQDRFVLAVKTKQKYLHRCYLLNVTIIELFFLLYPILTEQFACIRIWTPFNGRVENIVTYTFENCSVLVISLVYAALDGVFIGFTSTVVAQIEILKDNLIHSTDRNSEEDYARQEQKIQERLRTCIIQHNAILDLTRRVEELFSSDLFWHIAFSALQVCFGGMQVMTETDAVMLLFWWTCFVTTIGTILVACWFGQEIITESSGIIEACYMSEWYTCTPSTRKMFFIIMEQAKRAITLNGRPFFTLSFQTFTNVLRSAYSYYAVFRQVYEK